VTSSPQAKGRRPLLLLVVLFVAPLAGAFLLYYGSSWRPANHTTMGNSSCQWCPCQARRSPAMVPGVIGAGDAGCDARCRDALIYARQTWLSLGKLTPRARRVLLGGAGCCDRDYLQREHTGLLGHAGE